MDFVMVGESRETDSMCIGRHGMCCVSEPFASCDHHTTFIICRLKQAVKDIGSV